MIDASNIGQAVSYDDDAGAFPKPRWRSWRTWFKRPRPTKRFAPRIHFNPLCDPPDPESVAHWGEHIIVEDTVTVLHRDGTFTSRQHLVTQLSGANELAVWDEVVRSFDTRRETHRVVSARLMMPGGPWQKAENKIYTVSAPGGRTNAYGRTILLRYQPLRPGVILELEETFDGFRIDEFGPTVSNQIFLRTGAPCRHRRFVVAVASPFELHYQLHHGAQAPQERQEKDYRICTWEVREAEGCESDEWTPPARDFLPWVDVSTASSWTPFAERLRKELEPPATVGRDVAQIAEEVGRDKTTPLEKAAAAYTYVARSVRYGRPPTETFGRNIRKAEQILQDLRGDCKDKSALLVQLLRVMKMDARIAVVLTGDAGRTPFLPSARFNHALVRLEHDGQVHWLDAAGGPFAFGELPDFDIKISALVLGQDSFCFDTIATPNGSQKDVRECRGSLAADGSYEFQFERRLAGEGAARLRMMLADRTEKHRLRVLQAWLGSDFPGAAGSEFAYEAIDDLAKPFNYRCRARLDRVARRIKDLQLFRVPWTTPLSMSGPMTATERKEPLAAPVDYHVAERHEIELPAGVTPYAVPDAVTLQCDWGTYACRIEHEAHRLVCQREMRLAGTHVPGERFAEYQDFWRQCSWADGAEIVLRDQ